MKKTIGILSAIFIFFALPVGAKEKQGICFECIKDEINKSFEPVLTHISRLRSDQLARSIKQEEKIERLRNQLAKRKKQ